MKKENNIKGSPIGIFDSGFGGLTVMQEIIKKMPQHDFLYLGDNARAPYGTRSFASIYEYTLEAVKYLFQQGCPLVILACNTASARALRTIQQKDLPRLNPDNRVLGIIRPTAEVIGNYSKTREVGVLGTPGTIRSESYIIEIKKEFPDLKVVQEACPMWVPLVENKEHKNKGADYFVEKRIKKILKKSDKIDTLLLGCTHYPLLLKKIKKFVPSEVTILNQGEIVAVSLVDYLIRHPEMENRLSKKGKRRFLTTDFTENFNQQASTFFGYKIQSEWVKID